MSVNAFNLDQSMILSFGKKFEIQLRLENPIMGRRDIFITSPIFSPLENHLILFPFHDMNSLQTIYSFIGHFC